jgi:hypothetical protein
MRDGKYVTDRLFRVEWQGIYFWSTGAFFLVGNPSGESSTIDHTLVLPNNASYTLSDLWDAQVDAAKFAVNPFTNQPTRNDFPNTQTINKPEKPVPFGQCNYQGFFQLETKAVSQARSTPRLWKPNRRLPFEALEDEETVSVIDEERLVYHFQGYMVSQNCEMMLEVRNDTRSGDFDRLVSSGKAYVFCATINILCLIALIASHLETRKSNSAMMKVSAAALVLQVSYDVMCTLFHLILAFHYSPLNRPLYFITFLSFVLFSLFQMRYLLDVLKLGVSFTAPTSLGGISIVYTCIYSLLFVSIGILLLAEWLIWIPLLLINSSWIGQIYHNARHRARNSWDWHVILGTSLCRLFTPIYFYMLPQNFIAVRPRSTLVLVLVLWNLVQLLVLLAQDKFGSRFFIPSWMLPPVYNYHRTVPTSVIEQAAVENHPLTCAICMSEVSADNGEHMITPCNHVFHEVCLVRWMDQKMECPVCRGRLPLPPSADQPPPHDAHSIV